MAITAIGARLIVGRDAPRAPLDGAALLAEAARQGNARAWGYVAILAASGVGRAQSWLDAFAALDCSARLGDVQSERQLRLLRGMGIYDAAGASRWCASAKGTALCDAPRLVSYADFLTPETCKYLIDYAAPSLVRARVRDLNNGTLKVDPMRTNTGAAFSFIDTDFVVQLIRSRIAHCANVAVASLEPPEVLHYSIGESFSPHVDFFHPDVPQMAEQIRIQGQRTKTCLVYLNDEFGGGSTDFPRIGMAFRGRAGEALTFENVRPNGDVDMNTLHAGTPPTHGEKWLLSQWIRDRPQPLV